MGFGCATTGNISTNTAYSVQQASKMDEQGRIDEETTYGGVQEVTEETYVDAGSFTNLATNGQTGNVSTAVVTSHTLIESNTDYARASKVSRKPLGS
jgi:DNA/RNA endonuclease YhcR with UshA esterase domain